MSARRRFVHAIALIVALARCTTRHELSEECVFNGDCREGLVCAGHTCRLACRDGRDCAAGLRCTGAGGGLRACIPDEEPGYCRMSSECSVNELCQSGRCLRVCARSGDCVSSQACNLGRCVPSWIVPVTDAASDIGRDASDVVAPGDVVDASPPDDIADASGARDASDVEAGDGDVSEVSDASDATPPVDVTDASTDVGPASQRIVEICASGDATCARSASGRVWCWGSNEAGGLAQPPEVPFSPTPLVVADAEGATMLACGAATYTVRVTQAGHACVRTADGRVRCWGNNRYSQVGGTADNDVFAPVLLDLGEPLGAFAVSARSTLAITVSGALWGWGSDDDSVLFSGSESGSLHPTPSRSVLREPVRLAAVGDLHSCVVGASGRLLCVGANTGGAFGVSYAESAVVPLEIDAARAFAPDIVSMVAGTSGSILLGGFTCVATRDGVTRCSGNLPFLPTGTRAFTPVDGLRGALRLYTNTSLSGMGSGSYVCALRDDLTVRCLHGRTSAVPPLDLPFTDVFDLALGVNHICALRSDGSVYCFGSNNVGQLGAGDTVGSSTPRRVEFPP